MSYSAGAEDCKVCAAVVRFLREQAPSSLHPWEYAADAIERGDHMKEKP